MLFEDVDCEDVGSQAQWPRFWATLYVHHYAKNVQIDDVSSQTD